MATLVLMTAAPASAGVYVLTADRDNTLYEAAGGASNGSGPRIFAGRTLQSSAGIRRGLIHFDLSLIPAGEVVDSAVVAINVSKVPPTGGAHPINLHRVTSDWGEGASNAGFNGGTGAAAQAGDATWTHRFHPGVPWTAPGGDFVLLPSATGTMGGTGFVNIGPLPTMTSDVQVWLDNPSNNFGWMLIGEENVPGSARRLDSRENADGRVRPKLTVYTSPGPVSVARSSWGRVKATYR